MDYRHQNKLKGEKKIFCYVTFIKILEDPLKYVRVLSTRIFENKYTKILVSLIFVLYCVMGGSYIISILMNPTSKELLRLSPQFLIMCYVKKICLCLIFHWYF